MTATLRPAACSPRSLRAWTALYRRGGKVALADACAKQGGGHHYFSSDELALLGEVIRTEFLTLQRKPVARVVEDVKVRFKAENELRSSAGRPPLRVPGRDAVRAAINRMDRFTVLIARFGAEHAIQKLRPVKEGLQVARPFERVEMDEQKIDLISILSRSGLLGFFSDEELELLGLLDQKKRWWLVLAIDVRTRCIVGMTLTRDPRSSAALKCLRMVTSDKGQFADKIGALAPWSIFGTPETLVTDNGAAFKSSVFTSACADLGIQSVQAIGGAPGMRGVGERVFGTLSSGLMPRLAGRTFSNVLDRGDQDPANRACLSIESLTVALVRWAVDIYHNTPHEGLGGRTPLQQWETDLRDGNMPLRTAPSARSKRIALGVALDRVLQKDGIRVMNVRYHSRQLAEFHLRHGNMSLEVRWCEEDLGSIEVLMDGGWWTVPTTSEMLAGVHASVWQRVCRSLRAKDPKRKEWEDHVVAAAIRDIEVMNASAMAAFEILDHAWTRDRVASAEAALLQSFDLVPKHSTASTPHVHRGRVIMPVVPAGHRIENPRVDPDRHRLPSDESAPQSQPGRDPMSATERNQTKGKVGGRASPRVSDDDGWEFPG